MVFVSHEILGKNKSEKTERISPKDVTWENVPIFEEQVRRDVPIGTATDDVLSYLRRQEIKHTFHIPDKTVNKNTILAVLENLGRKGPFLVSLAEAVPPLLSSDGG